MRHFKVTIIFFIVLLSILLVELGLRLAGIQPGTFQAYEQFEEVDSLYLFNNYSVDEAGIYRFSSYISDSIKNADIQSLLGNLSENYTFHTGVYQTEWGMDRLGATLVSFNQLRQKEKAESAFEEFALQTIHKKVYSAFDSLILSYLNHPFNNKGFRSIAFDSAPLTNQTKILLLGDSFTYGQSASPIYNSFADLLLAKGYMVYNTGISGTDPAQYNAIVQRYIDELSPDVVILNFCLGNDFMPSPRLCKKDQAIEYLSNAGFFYSSPLGQFLSLEDAYNYYKSFTEIPRNNWFNRLMANTALSTTLWGVLYQQAYVNHPVVEEYEQWKYPPQEKLMENTLPYLESIASETKERNIPLLLVLLPDFSTKNENGEIPLNPSLDLRAFEKFNYYYPANFTSEDFPSNGDFHFNNQGSAKYAYFLDSLIQFKLLLKE